MSALVLFDYATRSLALASIAFNSGAASYRLAGIELLRIASEVAFRVIRCRG